MDFLALLNAELANCKLELEAVSREVRNLSIRKTSDVLPELKQASERMREIAARVETLTRAVARSSNNGVH